MARVISVEAERFPIEGVFTISRGSKTEAEVITCTIREGSNAGRGECVPYRRYGETMDGVRAQIDAMRPRLETGISRAALVNPKLGLGLSIAYANAELPNFIQWKCMASGDYVMGLEPSNCFPEGLQRQMETGGLRMLAAGERIRTTLTLRVLTGEALAPYLRALQRQLPAIEAVLDS